MEEWASRNYLLRSNSLKQHPHKVRWKPAWIWIACSNLQPLNPIEVSLECQMHLVLVCPEKTHWELELLSVATNNKTRFESYQFEKRLWLDKWTQAIEKCSKCKLHSNHSIHLHLFLPLSEWLCKIQYRLGHPQLLSRMDSLWCLTLLIWLKIALKVKFKLELMLPSDKWNIYKHHSGQAI